MIAMSESTYDADGLALLLGAIGASEVIEITAANFATVVDARRLALVLFYDRLYEWQVGTRWLDEASKVLAYSGVNLGRVEASQQRELCARYGIERFP